MDAETLAYLHQVWRAVRYETNDRISDLGPFPESLKPRMKAMDLRTEAQDLRDNAERCLRSAANLEAEADRFEQALKAEAEWEEHDAERLAKETRQTLQR